MFTSLKDIFMKKGQVSEEDGIAGENSY